MLAKFFKSVWMTESLYPISKCTDTAEESVLAGNVAQAPQH